MTTDSGMRSPFYDKHQLNLLFALYDSISDSNVFLTRKDLLDHPRFEFNNRALDAVLKDLRVDGPNKLVEFYSVSHPNKVVSYALSPAGVNFVYGVKTMQLYSESCDSPERFRVAKEQLDLEYREKARSRARVLADREAFGITLDLKEVPLDDDCYREVASPECQGVIGVYLKTNRNNVTERHLVRSDNRLEEYDPSSEELYGSRDPRGSDGDSSVFVKCLGTTLVIDAAEHGSEVRGIDVSPFTNSGVETVILSSNITEVGAASFRNWGSLHQLVLPEGVVLGRYAFDGCSALGSVSAYPVDSQMSETIRSLRMSEDPAVVGDLQHMIESLNHSTDCDLSSVSAGVGSLRGTPYDFRFLGSEPTAPVYEIRTLRDTPSVPVGGSAPVSSPVTSNGSFVSSLLDDGVFAPWINHNQGAASTAECAVELNRGSFAFASIGLKNSMSLIGGR